MKIKCTLWAAMAALLFASCSKDTTYNDIEVSGARHAISIKAAMPEFDGQSSIGESEETRAIGQSVIRLQWAAGDQVSVINLTTGKALGGNLTADQAGIVTTFSGTVTGTVNEGDKIALLYPAQNYTAEQNFTAEINFANQTGSDEVQIAAYGTFDYTEGDFDAAQAKFQFLMSYVRMNMTDLSVKHVGLEKDIEEVIITGLPTGMTLAWDSTEQEIVATPGALGKITLTPNVKPADNGSKTLFFTTPAASGALERTIYVKQKHTTWRAAEWSTADLRAKGLYNTIVNKYTVAEDQHIAMPAAEDIIWAQNFDLFTAEALEATGGTNWDVFSESTLSAGSDESKSRYDKAAMADLWAAAGVRSLDAAPKLYAHVGCIKLGTATVEGDVAFSLPTLTEATNIRIVLKAVAYHSGSNIDTPAPYNVKVTNGGKAATKTFTVENYTYPEWAQTYDERANYQTIEVYAKGVTAESTIQLKAAKAANCRIYIDEIVVARDLTTVYPPDEEEEPELEGLPVEWTFIKPANAKTYIPALGSDNKTIDYATNPWFYADDLKARFGIQRNTSDASKTYTYANDTGTDATDVMNRRLLASGTEAGDCWLFELPVKNFKAGTQVQFYTWTQSSKTGPGYFLLQYSVDGENWTDLEGVITEYDDIAEEDVSYNLTLYPNNGKLVEVNKTFTVDSAIANGTLSFRMLIVGKRGPANTAMGTSGTSRICRRLANDKTTYASDPMSFKVVE